MRSNVLIPTSNEIGEKRLEISETSLAHCEAVADLGQQLPKITRLHLQSHLNSHSAGHQFHNGSRLAFMPPLCYLNRIHVNALRVCLPRAADKNTGWGH